MLNIQGYTPTETEIKERQTAECRNCLYKEFSNGIKVASVTFRGKCYTTSAVNYVMYGHVMRLCYNSFDRGLTGHFSADRVIDFVWWGKARAFWDEAETATRLALSGYSRSGDYKMPESQLPCDPSARSVQGNPKNWHWDDIQNNRN
jgi:hypothetical protein